MGRVSSPSNWPLLYHTITNLQVEQLTGMLKREGRQYLLPHLPIDFDARYEADIPVSLLPTTDTIQQNTGQLRASLNDTKRDQYRQNALDLADGAISFHDDSLTFDGITDLIAEDTQLASYSPLWRLKLHAFTPLNWLVLGFKSPAACPDDVTELVRAFITHWDEAYDIGGRRYLRSAWIPHAVSLRIVAVCRYYAWLDDVSSAFADRLRRFIYKNAAFLANHVEYDVGGNHLIENAAALLMASQFFETAGTAWYQTSRDIFERAAHEQFLADGGHFERSPMYHILVLQRYLTAVNLLSISSTETDPIRDVATAGTRYLRSLTPPDRRMPLLNDSAFGEFLSLSEALAYADAVGIDSTSESLTRMDESGYYWLGSGASKMLIDGGPVGPPHLPGHSHNDMLSFLLWVNGQRVVTDTGAYEYVPDETRQYVRSVRAHNTAYLDDHEPIDIGGQYLMGRRTTPTTTYSHRHDRTHFEGSYTKRSLGDIVYRHKRTVQSNGQWWCLRDLISQTEASVFRARIHLDPTVTVDRNANRISIRDGSDPLLEIHPLNASDVTELQTPYFPRFGEQIERTALEFEYEQGTDGTGVVLSRQDHETVKIVNESGSSLLRLDDQTYSLQSPG